MGSGESRGIQQGKRRELETRAHNAKIAESIWEILGSLSDTIESLQSNAGEKCSTLKTLGVKLKRLFEEATKPGNLSSPIILETLRTLKTLGGEVLKKLGKICCESPGNAQECSLQVSHLVEKINKTSRELVYKFDTDKVLVPKEMH